MNDLVQFTTDSSEFVAVEIVRSDYGDRSVGNPVVPQVATRTLETALAVIKPATSALVEAVEGLSVKEVQVEFGVALEAEIGAFVAKSTGSAHFQVTLTCCPSGSQDA